MAKLDYAPVRGKMFITSYDDRMFLPSYVTPFLRNTARFGTINFITPAKNRLRRSKHSPVPGNSSVKILDPKALPQFGKIKTLFDGLFFNYSTNSADVERACFLRWFAVNQATADLDSEEYICLLDTDFLIGTEPSRVLEICQLVMADKKLELIAEWEGLAPVAIGPELTIMTKSFLYSFCEYLLTDYFSPSNAGELRKGYFSRIGNGMPGGICDMRALASFVKERGTECFNLRSLSTPGFIGNFNVFLGTELAREISWKLSSSGGSQTLETSSRTLELVGTHFQGSAKRYMEELIPAAGESGFLSKEVVRKSRAKADYGAQIVGFARRIQAK